MAKHVKLQETFITCSSVSLDPCNNAALVTNQNRESQLESKKITWRTLDVSRAIWWYIRNDTGWQRTSLRELPLSISSDLHIYYISIGNRLSSTCNQAHTFHPIVIFTNWTWPIINVVFLPNYRISFLRIIYDTWTAFCNGEKLLSFYTEDKFLHWTCFAFFQYDWIEVWAMLHNNALHLRKLKCYHVNPFIFFYVVQRM